MTASPAARIPELILGTLVAAALFALMVLTCVDVIGRYWFNSPVPGASELTQFGMGLVVFGALPLVSARGGHVTIGLMEVMTGGRVLPLQRFVMSATTAVALAVMGWRLAITGQDLASYGDTSSFLRIPLAPMAWFMSVMALLGAGAALLHLAMPAEADAADPPDRAE